MTPDLPLAHILPAVLRIVGIALDVDDDAVLNLNLHAAADVAHAANRRDPLRLRSLQRRSHGGSHR